MTQEKMVMVRLFFNRGDSVHYVQFGEHSIFKIPEKVAARLQEKEGVSIVHVLSMQDLKEISKKEKE